MILTQTELQQRVERCSLRDFGRPFIHQAVFNKRLRSTGGRYHLADHHLDFNEQLFAESDEETIEGVIKHELCHYHLHLSGRGYRHRDKDFKQLLQAVGGARYAPPAKQTKTEVYQCETCGTKIYRRRKFDVRKYRCGACRGRLHWVMTRSAKPEDR